MKLMEKLDNVYAIADELKHKVHSIIQTDNDLQVVVDYYPAFKIHSIVVFKSSDNLETLGLIQETEDNEKHRVLYIEVNPNQEGNFNINNVESILLWGAL